MKKLIVIGFWLVFIYPVYSAPSITVVSPNGGEVIDPYKPFTIKWQYQDIDPNTQVGISIHNYLDNREAALNYEEGFGIGTTIVNSVPVGNKEATVVFSENSQTYYMVRDTLMEYVHLKIFSWEPYFKYNDISDNPFSIGKSPSGKQKKVSTKLKLENNESSIAFGSKFVVSWESTGVNFCSPYGSYVPMEDDKIWTDSTLPASGTATLIAKHKNLDNVQLLELGIQCYDEEGRSTKDLLNIPIRTTSYILNVKSNKPFYFIEDKVMISSDVAYSDVPPNVTIKITDPNQKVYLVNMEQGSCNDFKQKFLEDSGKYVCEYTATFENTDREGVYAFEVKPYLQDSIPEVNSWNKLMVFGQDKGHEYLILDNISEYSANYIQQPMIRSGLLVNLQNQHAMSYSNGVDEVWVTINVLESRTDIAENLKDLSISASSDVKKALIKGNVVISERSWNSERITWSNGNKLIQLHFSNPLALKVLHEYLKKYPSDLNQLAIDDEYVMNVNKGWNLISIPVMVRYVSLTGFNSDCKRDLKFLTLSKDSTSYEVPENFNPKSGFWVYSEINCTANIKGSSVPKPNDYFRNYSISKGWNLIGASLDDVEFPRVKGNCEISKGPYYFNGTSNSWQKSLILKPGLGYLVKVNKECILSYDDKIKSKVELKKENIVKRLWKKLTTSKDPDRIKAETQSSDAPPQIPI